MILGLNWKQNPATINQAKELFLNMKQRFQNTNQEVILGVPSLFLSEIKSLSSNIGDNFKLASQDISEYENGAHTAEISPVALKSFGINYAIVGHSETRKYWKLTNQTLNQKLKACQQNGITPVYCIGFSEDENSDGINYEELKQQLVIGLDNLDLLSQKVIIAYEPVWAIVTGKTASPEVISEVLA